MAIQNLRSSDAHKRPIPTVLSAGQIAINTNEASPGLFFKDSNGDLVKVGPVHIGTSAPNSSPATTAADALVSGTVYQILTVGNTDFTAVGASANTVGTVFTATGAGTGTGTVSGQQGNEKGEQWLDTTGGAYDLKIYDGSAWRSQAGEFVNASGDNMTGNLTLGTDKVVLNASSGAGTFSGTITADKPRSSTAGDGTGGFLIHPSDTTTYYNFRHDSADNGLHIDTTDGANRILFGIDGAATFAGKLQSKNSSDIAELASGTNTGFRLLENGTDANVVMGWNGSATFKDTVQATDGTQYTKIYNSGFVQANRTNGANYVFEGRLSNSTTSIIKGDGSANFTGDLTLGSYNAGSNGVRGLFYTETAGLTVQAPAGTTQSLFKGLGGSSSDVKFNINADGSAEFASNIETGNYNASSSSGQGVVVYASGALNIQRAAGASVDARFQIRSGDTQVVAMNNDGSATFAGEVEVGGGVSAADGYGTRIAEGQIVFRNDNQSAANCLRILKGGDNYSTNVVTALKNDGSATFRNTITSGASDRRGQFLGTCPSSVNAAIADAFVAQYDGSTNFSVKYTGSATFAGDVTIGKTTTGASDIGARFIKGSSSQLLTLDCVGGGSGDVAYQVNNSGSATVQIKADGSATFAGNVQSGGNAIQGRYTGIVLRELGVIQVARQGSEGVFTGFQTSDNNTISNATSQINADGSASFAGVLQGDQRVVINGAGGKTGSANTLLNYAGDGSTVTASFTADGAAEFESSVTSKYSGQGQVQTAASISHGVMVKDNGGNINVALNWNGSSTFASHITVNNGINTGSNTNYGSVRYGGGEYYAQTASASAGTVDMIRIYYGTNVTTRIRANGSAIFATDVKVTDGRFDSSVGGTSSYSYVGRLGSTIKYHVLGDGSAYFAGNITAGNVSDIKFKENITDANPQLSDVVALGGILKNWDWKAEAPLNEELRAKRFLGLVAQEAEVICPGVTYEVSRTIQGEELTPETTDEEGNVTPATYEEVEESYKAINHDILVMKLLGAVAELTAKNDTLEAKVAALEAG